MITLAKIALIYASMSGNTEQLAEAYEEGIRSQTGVEIDVIQAMDADASVLKDYNGIVIGSYTWGDGELPDEFLDFFEELDDLDLSGKKAAVFGTGDKSYDIFCAAVDIFIVKLKELGADVFQEGFKVELTPNDEETEQCRELGKSFAISFIQ